MKEITPKIQITIMALLLVIAAASFFFGPGILKSTIPAGQPSAQVTMLAPPQTNLTEKDMILGRWAKDPDRDNPDVLENWTFYEDGTFSESHDTSNSADPASFDHGTWEYMGNNDYAVTLDGEQMNILRTGNILENVDDNCTFHRIKQ